MRAPFRERECQQPCDNVPKREHYLSKLAAAVGAASYPRAQSASGYQQVACNMHPNSNKSNFPSVTTCMDDFEVSNLSFSQPRRTISSGGDRSVLGSDTFVDLIKMLSGGLSTPSIDSGNPPLRTVGSKTRSTRDISTSLNGLLEQSGRTDVKRQTGGMAPTRPSDLREALKRQGLDLPPSLPNRLKLERQELERMLKAHGWTGTQFTLTPDPADYMKMLSLAYVISSDTGSQLAAQVVQHVSSSSHEGPSASYHTSQGKVQATDEEARTCDVHTQRPAQLLLVSELLPRPKSSPSTDQQQQHRQPVGTSHIPQKNKLGASSEPAGPGAPVTTFMIQHLPTEITQREVLEELDRSGFKDLYDFCHMPCDFAHKAGLGFAFVNLVSESAAAMFETEWHGSFRCDSHSTLNIRPAAVQGYEANVQKWSSQRLRKIRNPSFRPFIAHKCDLLGNILAEGFEDAGAGARNSTSAKASLPGQSVVRSDLVEPPSIGDFSVHPPGVALTRRAQADIDKCFDVSDAGLNYSPMKFEGPAESEVPTSIPWLRTAPSTLAQSSASCKEGTNPRLSFVSMSF